METGDASIADTACDPLLCEEGEEDTRKRLDEDAMFYQVD